MVNKEGKEEVFRAEKALMAVGRSPYTDGLQLEKAGVALNGKFIKVNEKMETTSPGIYAIGDVTGRQMLAHKASAEGVAAAENAVANARESRPRSITPRSRIASLPFRRLPRSA